MAKPSTKVFMLGLPDETLEHIRRLPSIPEAAVAKFFAAGFFSTSDGSLVLDEEKVMPVAQDLGMDAEELRKIMMSGLTLAGLAAEYDEDIERVAADAASVNRADAKDVPALAKRLMQLRGFLDRNDIVSAKKQGRALAAVLPQLEFVSARAVAVPVYERQFTPEFENVTDYHAKLAKIAHCVVLQMDTDQFGSTKRFSIGLTVQQVDALIARLQAAKIQVSELEAKVGLK